MAITLFVSAIVLMALGFPVAFALAMSAARMKKGTAISGKLSIPVNISLKTINCG